MKQTLSDLFSIAYNEMEEKRGDMQDISELKVHMKHPTTQTESLNPLVLKCHDTLSPGTSN